jgi:hypothetical protein
MIYNEGNDMKKVLLATTILGMTAGFASAEIAFSGEAKVGFAQNGVKNGGARSTFSAATPTAPANAGAVPVAPTADSVINPYANTTLNIAATGDTGSGLTFGVNMRMRAGVAYSFGNEDGFANRAGTFELREIFLAGDFGKVTYLANGFKAYKDDGSTSEAYDIEYTHTIAGFAVGVRAEVNGRGQAGAHASKTSLKLGYTAGAFTLGGTFDEVGSLWGLSAAYKLNDMLTFTVTTDNAQESSVAVAYSANGISAGLKGIAFKGGTSRIEVSAGYKANGWDISASADNRAVARWSLSGSYDLGGGLSVEAGANYTDDMYLGAKMKF